MLQRFEESENKQRRPHQRSRGKARWRCCILSNLDRKYFQEQRRQAEQNHWARWLYLGVNLGIGSSRKPFHSCPDPYFMVRLDTLALGSQPLHGSAFSFCTPRCHTWVSSQHPFPTSDWEPLTGRACLTQLWEDTQCIFNISKSFILIWFYFALLKNEFLKSFWYL